MKEKWSRIRNIIKKIPGNKRLCFCLGICLLVLAGTGAYQAFAEESVSAYVVSFSNQSRSIKTSQLLEVKTDGFAKNAYLQYMYQNQLWTRTDNNIVWLEQDQGTKVSVFSNNKTYEYNAVSTVDAPLATIDKGQTKRCYDPFFAVAYGERAYAGESNNGYLKITVEDINTESSTYGKIATANIKNVGRSNYSQDVNQGMGAMFVGEEMELRQLMATGGLTRGKEALLTSEIKNFNARLDDGITYSERKIQGGFLANEQDGYFFTSSASGMGSVSFWEDRKIIPYVYELFYIDRSVYGNSFKGQWGYFDFYVFEKKPEVIAMPTYITVKNTMKGVTYSIGNESQIAQSDNETLVFGKDEKFKRGVKYQLLVSKPVNGKTARAFVEVTTPDNSTVYFNYNGIEPTNGQESSISLEYGENLSKFLPEALGYDFLNWNSTADGTGINYSEEGIKTSPITVYAQWKVRKHPIEITIKEDKELLENANVELCQYGKKLYELTDAGQGVYRGNDIPYAKYKENDGAYDIYVNGVDSGVDFTMTGEAANGVLLKDEVYGYTATVKLTSNGQALADANVRIEKSGLASTLSYDAATETYRTHFQYDKENPKDGPYYIYVNETMIKGEKSAVTLSITDNLDTNKVDVAYYDVAVDIQKDGQPWQDAQVFLCKDDIVKYALSYNPDTGKYEYTSILDVGSVYQLQVKGSNSKDNTGEELSSIKTTAAVDYYTVTFKDDQKICTEQIWKSGDCAKKPNNPVREDATFWKWNENADGTGDTYFTGGQNTTEPITKHLDIFAVWKQPNLVIGNYVRVNADGTQSGKGLYYKMSNLSITGFPNGTGKTPIQIIKIDTENEKTEVLVKNAGTYKVKGNNTNTVTITIPGGTSATEAENFIRNNILIKPDGDSSSHACTVRVFGTTT